MRNALVLFDSNLSAARNLEDLYAFLSSRIVAPISFDDLLRSQVVYAVSAFDKLVHDLVRIGMVQIFSGNRPPTSRYLSELISIELHGSLISATVPPKEYVFEQAIFRKLKLVSYQDPTKVADGLSYIWDESHKWQQIAMAMGVTENAARTTLKLIADRRNAIVHEADTDPTTNAKLPIDQVECRRITDFLRSCGVAIARLVT